MDTFNGSKPNLISSKTLKDIELDLDVIHIDDNNNVINGLSSFYNNYISQNLFPLIIIGFLALYLTIKYILKRDRDEAEYEINETKSLISNQDLDSLLQEREKERNIEIIKRHEEITLNNNDNNSENISDMISDDYLLDNDSYHSSQDDIDDRLRNANGLQNVKNPNINFNINPPEMTGLLTQDMLLNNEPIYNVDKVADVIFGK